MQSTLQNLPAFGQIQAASGSNRFRPALGDCQAVPVRTGLAVEYPQYEDVGLAELLDAVTDGQPVPRDIERQCDAALGQAHVSQLKKLLMRVWETDRMI